MSHSPPAHISTDVQRRLRNRGPDHFATHATRLGNDDDQASTTHIAFTSTVLALRGDHIARQPFVDEKSGSVFCWNGEAWRIRDADVSGNDGEAIASLLHAACHCAPPAREGAIMKVLRSIDGPFAFVFFDRPSQRLYFGRDRLGRRSLLLRQAGECLVLSSIADSRDPEWREVEADGVYALELVGGVYAEEKEMVLPQFAKLEWLEREDTAEIVSEQRRRASGVEQHPSNYNELTDQGLRHWHFQRFIAQPSGFAIFNVDFGRGPLPAIDELAKVACSQCASFPKHK